MAPNDDEICADSGGLLHNHARRSPKNGLCTHGAVRATERARRCLELLIDELSLALMQGGVPVGRQIEITFEQLIDMQDFDPCSGGPAD